MHSVWQWVALGFGVFAVLVVLWWAVVLFAFHKFLEKFDDDEMQPWFDEHGAPSFRRARRD